MDTKQSDCHHYDLKYKVFENKLQNKNAFKMIKELQNIRVAFAERNIRRKKFKV